MYGTGFWDSIEVTAWSQGGDWHHYLHVRKKCEEKGAKFGAPLDEESFDLLCDALNTSLHNNIEAHPNENPTPV